MSADGPTLPPSAVPVPSGAVVHTWSPDARHGVVLHHSSGATRLTADVSDAAQEFFKRRGFAPVRRNSVRRGEEWLANTTMEKKIPAKEGR